MDKLQRCRSIVHNRGLKALIKSSIDHLRREPLLPYIARYNYLVNKYYHGHSFVRNPLTIQWVPPHSIEYLTAPAYRNPNIRNPEDLTYVKGTSKNHPDYKYVLRGVFPVEKCIGTVQPGEWDQPENKFEDLYVYQGLKEHFIEGVEWKNTKYFQLVCQWIENGYPVRGCENPEEYLQKCRETDELFARISKFGFESQQEITGKFSAHEIGVNVGRNGALLFNGDGHHRLSIAKILNIEQVPVIIIAQHKELDRSKVA